MTAEQNSMNRRTLLALLAAPAVAHLLASCSSDNKRGGGGGGGDSEIAKSNLARVAVPVEDAKGAAEAINAFSDDLYRSIVDQDRVANVVFSPASVAIAMVMAASGGVGATAKEIYDTFHVADPATIDRSMNALGAHLDSLDRTEGSGEDKRQVTLNIANSLWGQRDLTFEAPFLDLLASQYGAQMNLVDYKKDHLAAVKEINAWVSDKTRERIPELLGEDDVSEDSRLVLVNAIYLLATWATQFKKEATSKRPFITAAGTSASVDMMHKESHYQYAAGAGWQAVDLPYSFDQLSFTALLPDNDTDELIALAEVLAAMESRKVRLGLPKFDFETSAQLGDILQSLGIEQAFGGDADFSGMTKQEQLSISKVIHQANITVDERGTEAAAATAVVMEATAAPLQEEPIELIFDRPFTFWIRDLASGAIIFAGRVTDPTQTR